MPRVTKDYFALYKHEVKFWMKHLGLTSWEPFFSFEKDVKNIASVSWDKQGGSAVFYLSTTWGKKSPITEKTISRTAFHEVCEVLLAELRMMGEYFVRASEVDRVVHEIIRHLENTVFEYEWNRRVS